MKITKLEKEAFISVCKEIQIPCTMNVDFLYNAYTTAIDGAAEMVDSNMFGKLIPVNSFVVLLYLVNEYGYWLEKGNFEENDESLSKIVSYCLDKYFTNEHLNYKNTQFTSKFSITISSLDVYLNLMLGVLDKFPQKNPKETLLVDFASKAFKLCKAITGLIVSGFETEAFSTWRTLHETECILKIIAENGDPIIHEYLKHMNYAVVFRGTNGPKEVVDKVFEQIKSEMKELDLKSKDMKKFIEYGWLKVVPNFKEMTGLKFNFRDGVEKMAGLSTYSKVYEMASEIAHSSPLLIYSKNKYFYHLTMLQLYETFFRLEKIFNSIYLPNVDEQQRKRYLNMRNVYYPIIGDIYKKEVEIFRKISNQKSES